MKDVTRRTVEVCSPIKGACEKCMIGKSKFCLKCNDNEETFEQEFVVLPGSADRPILGIQAMRDMDLVGKYPLLFRTAEALAQQPPPIASAGDKVTTQKPGSDSRKSVSNKTEGKTSPSKKVKFSSNLPKGEEQLEREIFSDPLRDNVAGLQGKLGIPEAMKSRRILKVGKRRVDGRSTPITAGTHGKRFGGGKRKLRELNQLIATLREHAPRDDGNGVFSVPTSSERFPESGAVEDGTMFHRDDIFTVMESDVDAAEAEEAWMEKRELIFNEASTDPLAQIKFEGPSSLQSGVRKLCSHSMWMIMHGLRPETRRNAYERRTPRSRKSCAAKPKSFSTEIVSNHARNQCLVNRSWRRNQTANGGFV